MNPELVLVLSNAPDALLAKRIAHYLLEERLAACVNLGAAGLSMYIWQGEMEGSSEVPLLIKTTRARVPEVIERIKALHPYEVPEILVLPVIGGFAPYAAWVHEQTQPLPD